VRLCIRCVLSVFAGYSACVSLCFLFAAHCVPVCLVLGVLSLQPSDVGVVVALSATVALSGYGVPAHQLPAVRSVVCMCGGR
jgi:hypothetical protein